MVRMVHSKLDLVGQANEATRLGHVIKSTPRFLGGLGRGINKSSNEKLPAHFIIPSFTATLDETVGQGLRSEKR